MKGKYGLKNKQNNSIQIFLNILRFFYNIMQMQMSSCVVNCKVQNLAQLWLCTAEGCTQPLLRCQQCFKLSHASADEQGKLRTHSHTGFDESPIYKNFLYFIRLYELISSKYSKNFGNVSKNTQIITWQIFSTSEFAKAFQSQQALTEFYTLKQLYNKRQSYFYSPPSKDLVTSLSMFSQKIFNNYRNLLLAPTEEEEYMVYYFNQVSDSNPNKLENFINREQEIFMQYCQEVQDKQLIFDVDGYISRRKKDDVDQEYFTKFFQFFLTEKYGQNPQKQQIFTDADYLSYIWQNLSIFSQSPSATAYLNQWVQNYNTFSEFMRQKNLQPTLLSFRMWKNHVPVSQQLKNKQKDKYFLDTFILAYIEYLINNSSFTVNNQSNQSAGKGWKQFIRYLKDYVDVSKLKGQEYVDLAKYGNYYDFRVFSQGMMDNLQKSPDISFNRAFCIEYLNQTYKQGGQISKKNYKKFFQTKTEQLLKAQNDLKQLCSKLQAELSDQQKQKFYKIIFNDYLKQKLQQNSTPNKEQYYEFKKNVLQKFDEEEIKLENDRLLLQEKQLGESEKGEKTEKIEKGADTKITHKIDQAEEVLNQEINSQNQGEAQVVCLCCNGNPDNCDKPECQMIGYCVTCNL